MEITGKASRVSDRGQTEPSEMSAVTTEVRVRFAGEKVRLLSLGDLDRRTAAYRRTNDLIEAIELDLGGADRLSTGQRALIQRAAVTAALAEHLETRWLAGEAIDPSLYCTVGNALRRLLETVGLTRVPRDVTGLGDLLAADLEAQRQERAS
jgi:hypothetical protein